METISETSPLLPTLSQNPSSENYVSTNNGINSLLGHEQTKSRKNSKNPFDDDNNTENYGSGGNSGDHQPKQHRNNNDLTNSIRSNQGNNNNNNGDDNIENDITVAVTTETKVSILKLPLKKKMILFCFTLVNVLASCTFSLLGPFYPQEGKDRGMNLTEIGIVFAVFQIIVFITAPVVGTFVGKIGPKLTFISGIVVASTCTILFGTLVYLPKGDTTTFLVASILVRTVQALGVACFSTASFAIVSTECEEILTQAFAMLETGLGIGYMVGPLFGGFMFTAGGFGVPFYVMGGLLLFNGLLVFKFLPPLKPLETKKKQSILRLFSSPMVFLAFLGITAASNAIACFETTFSILIEDFNLSTMIVSLIFIVPATLYGICGPMWGYLTDNKKWHKPLFVGGCFFYFVGFMMIGPSNLLPFLTKSIPNIVVGLALVGISFGAVTVPGVQCMIDGSVELGYPPNLDTYGLVSGLINSANSCGAFIGPLAGSAIVEKWGFPIGYTVCSFCCLVVGVMTVAYFLYRKAAGKDMLLNSSGGLLVGSEESVVVKSVIDDKEQLEKMLARKAMSRSLSMSYDQNKSSH